MRFPLFFPLVYCHRGWNHRTVTDNAGSITSPNFDYGRHNYPANARESWLIKSGDPRQHVLVQFTSYFAIEDSGNCISDSLKIYDGSNSSAPLLGVYCGIQRPPSTISSGSNLFVVFSSDSSAEETGFQAHYKGVTMEQSNINPMVRCGEYITADEGVIYSHGYPNLYDVNLVCMWRLTVNVGKSIQLTLRYLDIEDSKYCSRDSLTIAAVVNEDAENGLKTEHLRHICGKDNNHIEIDTKSNDIFVIFTSDHVSSKSGFEMYHNTGYAENACPSLTKLNETEGVVVTAVVDDEYDKMLNCAYLIEADPFNVVEIEIQGLISSSDCLQDNLGIYDGDTDHHRNIATVCGSPTPKIFTTTQDKALVVWHLDSTKKAQFYFRQKLNPFKSDLVEIPRPTFTTTTARITYPDKSHVTCVKCMHNVTRVDSNICRKNYIFEGQIRTPVKRIGEL
ncbi:unnamed protein product, partial [Oikopleura dioica]